MPDQQRHQPLQEVRFAEHNVGRPFRLIAGPVVAGIIPAENAFVFRIQLRGEAIQQFRPVHFHLPVHQFLRPLIVLQPEKAVPLLYVLHSFPAHLPGQPFPSVQPHLDVEGKPGLDTGVHPAHFGVDLILVQHVAGSGAANDVGAAMLERGTRLERAAGTCKRSKPRRSIFR